MPFISVNTSQKLSQDQKIEIKKLLGQNVSLMPTKEEARLMIDISDDHTMFLGGVQKEKIAFIDVRLYHMIAFKDKQAFTEVIFKGLESICELKTEDIFVNFVQLDTWGGMGSLK